MRYTLASVAGSLPPLHDEPQDFDEQIRLAKEERAERTTAPLRAGSDLLAHAPPGSATADQVVEGPARE